MPSGEARGCVDRVVQAASGAPRTRRSLARATSGGLVSVKAAPFWSRVDTNGPTPEACPDRGPCWLWLGGTSNSYGAIKFQGRSTLAHRVAWLLVRGAVPDGLELDHLCRNKRCCNPDHLEPVSHAENSRRWAAVAHHQHAKTHCPHGHPYSGRNLVIQQHPDGGPRRLCRACRNAGRRAARARHRAAA